MRVLRVVTGSLKARALLTEFFNALACKTYHMNIPERTIWEASNIMTLVIVYQTLGLQQLRVNVHGPDLSAVHLLLQPPLLDSLDDAVDDAGDMEEKTENDENWANYP